MANRVFRPIKDTVRAKESDHAQAKDGGGERHLLAGQADGFDFISYIKFDPDWDGVEKIDKAFLVLHTDENAHSGFPSPNAGVKVFRLASEFPDPNDAEPEGSFVGRYPVESKDPDSAANGFVLWGEGEESRIDITGLVADMAPKSVRRPNGKPGGAKTHHGFAIQRRTTDVQPNPRMCVAGMRHPDTSWRPFIELIYDPKKTANTVSTVGPTGDVASILDTSFTGTFNPGANQPANIKPARWYIQLFKQGGSDTVWRYEAAASSSDAITLTCTVPLSLVATTGSRYKFVSGQGYEWRLQAKDNKGVLTGWTAKRAFGILTNPPVLSNLRPTASPELETLNNVLFQARYSDPDGNPLTRFQVQVRTQTSPTDPLWGDDLIWDSGPVSGAGFAPRTPGQATEIKQPYGGVGLDAGTYSWRMRAWDNLTAESAWAYADFVLTKGWEPDPGDVDLLTGYANRRLKARILIKGFKNDIQTLVRVGDPNSGTFRLRYDGEVTDPIAWDASAATVEAELKALSNIGSSEVNVTKPNPNRWHVAFDHLHKNRPRIEVTNYSGFASDERIDVYSDRRPGIPIAIIDDAANIGASEMYNSGGEFYFSLPAVHPQVAVIEPYQTHYVLEHFRGESWREVAAGYITDFDATDNDVVFYGQDYMAILGRQVDERFNLRKQADAEANIWPEGGGGSKYVERRIHTIIKDQLDRSINDLGSPLAFFDRAAIPEFDEEVSIFVSFKERLPFIAGLIDSHRAGTGKRTRLYARRTGAGQYEWKVKDNPGKDRTNLRMEYGGLVQGFRVIPFGDFATRVNAIGRLYNKTKLEYHIARPPSPGDEDRGWYEETYGRFAQATSYEDMSDRNDLRRRANQRAKRISKVGKALALNIRPGSFSIKDGWDICDAVLVHIVRGVVDTRRMGSGLWTIWGWTWEVKPDGQELITLSLLPKEDASNPDEDLIASSPIHSDATWEAGHGPPGDDNDSDFYHDKDSGEDWVIADGAWIPMENPPYVEGQLTVWDGFSRDDTIPGLSLGNSELDASPWMQDDDLPAWAIEAGALVAAPSGGDTGTEAIAGNDSFYLQEKYCLMDFTVRDLPGPGEGRSMLRVRITAPYPHEGAATMFMQFGYDYDSGWWPAGSTPSGNPAFLLWGEAGSLIERPMTWEEDVVYRLEWHMNADAGSMRAQCYKLADGPPGHDAVTPELGAEPGENFTTFTYDVDGDGRVAIDVIWTDAGPKSGQMFEDHVVGTGDGVTNSFVGFPTRDGVGLWYVDGILTTPDFYIEETGGVVFDRPPAMGAVITQTGQAR